MKLAITNTEKESLKLLHRQIKDSKQRDKIKAILMLGNGYQSQEIAIALLLNRDTITQWKNDYKNREDDTSWLHDNYKGYCGKLTEKERDQISQYVETELISDSKQIQTYIYNNFGKLYSRSGIVDLLHRLNFTYKKTVLIPSKLDAEKQKAFKEAYDEFIHNLKEDEVLLFLDGVHPQHNTKSAYAWIKVGKEKQIKSNSSRQRLNITGAYNPFTQDILVREDKTINHETIIKFFKQIETAYPNKATVYIVLDQAPYNTHHAVLSYVETSRIELIQLPTYSPNLNLIERLWKLLRKDVITSYYHETFKLFKAATLEFLENDSEAFKTKLKQFIGLKLHLLKSS